jgi:hypothetical protein
MSVVAGTNRLLDLVRGDRHLETVWRRPKGIPLVVLGAQLQVWPTERAVRKDTERETVSAMLR